MRIIIITSWRSGSTLMGELLNSMPGSFYSYEPLTLFGINRIYNDSQLVPKAVNVIKNILKCNYSMVHYECKNSITFRFVNTVLFPGYICLYAYNLCKYLVVHFKKFVHNFLRLMIMRIRQIH